MTKVSTEPEVAPDRRQLIVKMAAELFAESSIAETTVREIGDAAGILSGSLYHYFPSKDAIVEEIMMSFLDDLTTRYEAVRLGGGTAIDQFRGLVAASLACTSSHLHAAEIYQNDINYFLKSSRFTSVQAKVVKIRSAWIEVLDAGIKDGNFRSDLPAWLVYHLLRDSIWQSVRWFKPSENYSYAALSEDCCKLFLTGFVANSASDGGVE